MLRASFRMASHVQRIIIPSGSDLFPLSALHFPSLETASSSKSSKARISSKPLPAVLIAPATGVPARFYLPFCNHLNSLGSPVLLFDYRYCGNSWPPSVGSHWSDLEAVDAGDEVSTGAISRGKSRVRSLIEDAGEVTYAHWATDVESAVRFLIDQYGEDARDIVYVANSVGGHLLPQIDPNVCKFVKRALYCGVFAPYHGLAPVEFQKAKIERWAELADEIKNLGYFSSKAAGFGADLPGQIGLEWAEMMNHPTYWAHGKDFSHFKTPILSLHMDDDLLCWGLTSQTDRVLECLPNSPSTRVAFNPLEMGWGPQGHIDTFHPRNQKTATEGGIWEMMSDFVMFGKTRLENGRVREFGGGVSRDVAKL